MQCEVQEWVRGDGISVSIHMSATDFCFLSQKRLGELMPALRKIRDTDGKRRLSENSQELSTMELLQFINVLFSYEIKSLARFNEMMKESELKVSIKNGMDVESKD